MGGGIELSVGSEFEAADLGALCQPRLGLGGTDRHAVNQAFGQIGEIKITLGIAAGPIGEAKIIADQFPGSFGAATGQHLVEGFVTVPVVGAGCGWAHRGTPQPPQRVGQNDAAVLAVVRAVSHHELRVVAGEGERTGHGAVGQGPVTVEVIEVVDAVLQEDSQRLALGLTNQGRVGVAAPDVGEAADLREHLAEVIRTFPSDRKRTNGAGTHAGDAPHFGVVANANLVLVRGEGDQLVDEESGVVAAERVVLEGAVVAVAPSICPRRPRSAVPGIEEQGNGDGHFPAGDQVIQHDGHPLGAVFADVFVSVLEHHECGGLAAVVLGRDVNPALAGGSGEHFRLVEFKGLHPPLEDARGAIRGIGS